MQGSKSQKKPIKYGKPERFALGLLFILFICDLHKAVEFSSIRHLADDRNLLLIHKSIIKIKHIHKDLKLTVEWIKANKLSS